MLSTESLTFSEGKKKKVYRSPFNQLSKPVITNLGLKKRQIKTGHQISYFAGKHYCHVPGT